MALKFVVGKRISLAKHPDYDERWVEAVIKQQPAILGLGEKLEYVSSQIKNSNGGRLDLLLADDEAVYSIELMLGQLDESHIIRALDYWLRNRTRQKYQNHEHIAVLVAERVLSSRFAEVVKELSSKLDLIVIELAAIQVEEALTLHCATIFDGSTAAEDEVEEESSGSAADWPKETLAFVNKVLDLVRPSIADPLQPNARKDGFGVRIGNRVENFIKFIPKAEFVRISAYLSDPDKWANKLQPVGIPVLSSREGSRLRFRLTPELLNANSDIIKDLCVESANAWLNS